MKYKVCLTTKVNTDKLEKGTGIIVIEPDDYTKVQVAAIKKKGYKVLAYLSVGTIEKERKWWHEYEKYKLKRLADWPKEFYMDVRKAPWRTFLLKRATMLKKMGYDGWWLDNIDVYSEYKSKTMFDAMGVIFRSIQGLKGYVMINGGSEWVDDAIDRKLKLKAYIDGYTQEEVFSRITDYSGKGKFGKQNKADSDYYKSLLKKAIKRDVGGFCLEYTRDKALKDKIKSWCKANKASYYISKDVNL